MFNLPTIRNVWESPDSEIAFVEVRGDYGGRYAYHVFVILLPTGCIWPVTL